MDEPLLREHKARETAAAGSLAGRLAKNRTSETTDPPKKSDESPVRQENIEKLPIEKKTNPCNKSDDALVPQEINKNLRQPKEEEETGGPLSAEKKPPLSAEKKPPLGAGKKSPLRAEKESPLRAEKESLLSAEKEPPLSAEKKCSDEKKPPLNTEKKPNNGDRKNPDEILQKSSPKASVQGAPVSVDALAEAADTFARIQRGTELATVAEDFAVKAREFANNPDDPVGRDRFLQQVRVLSRAVDAADIFHLLGAAYTVLSLHQAQPSWHSSSGSAAVSSDKKQSLKTPSPESLAEQSSTFAKSAAGTSMAAAADAFCRAAEHFAGGKGREKRVTDTELNKAAMALFSVAEIAPSSEAGLAAVAIHLTHVIQMILLSDTESKSETFAGWWWWRRASSTSDSHTKQPKHQLREAISGRDPILPIYTVPEKQLVDKREVLYALALAAPVAILTAAAGLNVFAGAWASVAGASVAVWILAAGGMVLNQYAVFDWERLAARHLGRLGVLGAAVLFSFFTYRAFFPSTSWALWFLLITAVIALGSPWMLSCIRGDDVISASTESAGDAAGGPERRQTV